MLSGIKRIRMLKHYQLNYPESGSRQLSGQNDVHIYESDIMKNEIWTF